jgi:hypothetical protein
MGSEIFVSKVDHFCRFAEKSHFSKSNLSIISHRSELTFIFLLNYSSFQKSVLLP